jgi:signal peptidase I
VLGVLLVDAVVAEVRTVDSDSMRPALGPREHVVVAKAGLDEWNLPVGQVVVFDAEDLWVGPGDPKGSVFVKRIIGVGGDRITCCDADGRLLRNGSPMDEPYLGGAPAGSETFDVGVQPGHYWLMGDNRGASADSRAHLGDPGGGSIPASRIIGTVEAVVWPPASARRVEGPDDGTG